MKSERVKIEDSVTLVTPNKRKKGNCKYPKLSLRLYQIHHNLISIYVKMYTTVTKIGKTVLRLVKL